MAAGRRDELTVKAPDFSYLRPDSLDGVFAALTQYGDDACILAGGQTLMALQNMRLAAVDVLVDINRVPGLADIVEETDHLVIGALVRYAALADAPLVRQHAPLLTDAVPFIAHTAIRNRGTIGGSLALGDPAAEMPDIEVEHLETSTETSELGAKGAGEAGTTGTFGAILNALNDALTPFDVTLSETPATPSRMLQALGKL